MTSKELLFVCLPSLAIMLQSSFIPQVKDDFFTTDSTSDSYIVNHDHIMNADTANAAVSKIKDTLNSKCYKFTGTTNQYVRGDMTLTTFPSIPTQFNLTSGTNTTVTGTYPNMAVNAGVQSDSVSFYSLSGRRSVNMKILVDTVSVTSSNGFTINYSAAGFSAIASISITPIKNTNTATSVPNVAIRNYSNTSVDLNFTEGNPNTVNVLGSLVGLGVSTAFASTTGLKVAIFAIGY